MLCAWSNLLLRRIGNSRIFHMTRPDAGELVFPIFAAGYTIYMLWQEIDAGLRQSSILYTMAVGIPVLMLCPIVLWRAFQGAHTGAAAKDALDQAPKASASLLPPLKVIAFLAITIATLLLIETLGYLISFTGFVLASMILLGVRSPLLLAAVPISTVAVVHVIFVMTLELELPKGILGSFL